MVLTSAVYIIVFVCKLNFVCSRSETVNGSRAILIVIIIIMVTRLLCTQTPAAMFCRRLFLTLSRSDRARAPLTLRSCAHMHHASRRRRWSIRIYLIILYPPLIHILYFNAHCEYLCPFIIFIICILFEKQTSDLVYVSRCYAYTNVIPYLTQLSALRVNVCIIL